MKIVVLDGYGLNPGDLSWNGLEALGELTVYDRTAPDELMERSSGAEDGDYCGEYGGIACIEIYRCLGYRI